MVSTISTVSLCRRNRFIYAALQYADGTSKRMMLDECLNRGRSIPVTPSTLIVRCFWPNLHGIVAATYTGISVRFNLRRDREGRIN